LRKVDIFEGASLHTNIGVSRREYLVNRHCNIESRSEQSQRHRTEHVLVYNSVACINEWRVYMPRKDRNAFSESKLYNTMYTTIYTKRNLRKCNSTTSMPRHANANVRQPSSLMTNRTKNTLKRKAWAQSKPYVPKPRCPRHLCNRPKKLLQNGSTP
jgi:hypothetical protein